MAKSGGRKIRKQKARFALPLVNTKDIHYAEQVDQSSPNTPMPTSAPSVIDNLSRRHTLTYRQSASSPIARQVTSPITEETTQVPKRKTSLKRSKTQALRISTAQAIKQSSSRANYAESVPFSANCTDLEYRDRRLQTERLKIIEEILDTEFRYQAGLYRLKKNLFDPLVTMTRSGSSFPLSNSETKILFGNLVDLLGLSKELTKRLERAESETIASTFSGIAPFLKLFALYASNFSEAMSMLNQKAAVLWPIWHASEMKQTQQRLTLSTIDTVKNDLMALLITPVQRLPRYALLLGALLKATPRRLPAHDLLSAALTDVRAITTFVNEQVRRYEKANELVNLGREWVAPGRQIIKRGSVRKILKSGKLEDRHLILLTDKLVMTTEKGVLKMVESLDKFTMHIIDDKDDFPNLFEIQGSTRSHSLIAKSIAERQAWVDSVHEAALTLPHHPVDGRGFHRHMSNASMFGALTPITPGTALSAGAADLPEEHDAPVWIPDHKAAQCMLCFVPFRFWRRRHHCRKCGKVVCHECSTHFEPMGANQTPLRTCDECKHANAEQAQQRRTRSDSGAHASQRRRVYSVIM